jgi:hypothetical protein
MIGQLKGEIAKYKEVQEDYVQDINLQKKEITRRDQMIKDRDN